MSVRRLRFLSVVLLLLGMLTLTLSTQAVADDRKPKRITIPGEDRFAPFAITVKVGQKVVWINQDDEDHFLVSIDAFNTAGHRGTDKVIPPNGKVSLTFRHAGVFPFYCSLHAMLDADNQPIAPGPDGGIQDKNGNFGTPMNGVVTVIDDTK